MFLTSLTLDIWIGKIEADGEYALIALVVLAVIWMISRFVMTGRPGKV